MTSALKLAPRPTPEQEPLAMLQVTYVYNRIQANGAAICGWCATRDLLLRYPLPFCAVIALELAAYYRLSAGTVRLTEVGVYVGTVVVLLMLSLLG